MTAPLTAPQPETQHDLMADAQAFAAWTEDAEGCDWCCGGGDDWNDDLDAKAKALGFTDVWDMLKQAEA